MTAKVGAKRSEGVGVAAHAAADIPRREVVKAHTAVGRRDRDQVRVALDFDREDLASGGEIDQQTRDEIDHLDGCELVRTDRVFHAWWPNARSKGNAILAGRPPGVKIRHLRSCYRLPSVVALTCG